MVVALRERGRPSSDLYLTYRIPAFHDVWGPGVGPVPVQQGVLADPVVGVEGALGGDGHQPVLPAQVHLQPRLSVPGGRGPTAASCRKESRGAGVRREGTAGSGPAVRLIY